MQKKTNHAVETIVFQSLIECTERDWIKIQSPVECKEAVEAFRKKVAPKGVALTQEMNELLDAWASGSKIKDPAAPSAAPSGSAQASGVPALKIDDPPAPSGSAAAARSREAPAAEAPTAGEEAEEKGQPKRKLTFAERMKEAADKRRRQS